MPDSRPHPAAPPRALAIFAHPDDIEYFAAGTLLLLRQLGWETHYLNVSNGDKGSTIHGREVLAPMRAEEARRAATILGAASALYDKYLLTTCGYNAAEVQAWFSIYLIPVMIPLLVDWFLHRRTSSPFQWRWSIPMIAILLLISDFLYFSANEQPNALISVISPLRRTSVIIAFLAGIRLYGEQNWRIKAVCLAGLMAGVLVISFAH